MCIASDKRDIMILPDDDDCHPFRYARLLRVFHGDVIHQTLAPKSQRLEFLWVRWFRSVAPPRLGWDRTELEKVTFIPANEADAFGFLSPEQVLRAAHIMPCYRDGRTKTLLGPSEFREEEGDWHSHYVGMCVCSLANHEC